MKLSFDKQLEIDKLNRSNEILVDKLDELSRKVEAQEIINHSEEKEPRNWGWFLKRF